MKIVARLETVSLLATSVLLACAAALKGGVAFAWGCLIWGGLGWLAQRRHWSSLSTFVVIGFLGAAVVGCWGGLGYGWLLLGTVSALAAWDLNGFSQQLRAAAFIEDEMALVATHLRQLAEVCGVSLILAGGASLIQLKLGLLGAMGLALLAVAGISQAIDFLRRHSA